MLSSMQLIYFFVKIIRNTKNTLKHTPLKKLIS